MSLPHVLLGMLSEPASGYELKQRFGESVRHFWSAELSQIYPSLARLEKDGMLKCRTEPSDKGPRRKIYSRTAKGRQALHDWLMDGPVCRTERIGYLTQLFFLNEIPPPSRMKFMRDLKADFEARLESLRQAEREWSANDPRYPDELPEDELFKQMTLQLGLMKYRMTVEWCEKCLLRMKRRDRETQDG